MQLRQARDQEFLEFSSELYELASSGQFTRAWEMLEAQLKKDRYSTEAEFFARLRQWDNPSLAVKAGQGFAQRLVKQGDFRTAWNVLEFCYAANGNNYRLTSSNAILKLMVEAQTQLQKEIVVSLLSHFEEDFPEHPRRAEVLLEAARLTAQDLNNFEAAREMMEHLHANYPDIYADKRYQALTVILAAGSS
jgi:TolA-binding protein